jgi:hypothetical protein
VEDGLAACVADAGGHHITVCAGCEVPRGTRPENLEVMRRFARSRTARA